MVEKYPEIKKVEDDLIRSYREAWPGVKIVAVKTPDKMDVGSEHVDNSAQPIPHVYFYPDLMIEKPDGSKWINHMIIAYYQSGNDWAMHYNNASLGSVQLSGPTQENPLKLTLEKARDLFRKYVDLMMKNNFPSPKWKSYFDSNEVEVQITNVDFKSTSEAESALKDINYDDPSEKNPQIGFVLDGVYKDKKGSFKFEIGGVYAVYYPDMNKKIWTLDYNLTPLENLKSPITDGGMDRLKDILLDPKEEPRTKLEKYAPEPSPKDKAMDMMKGSDEEKRFDGIEELKWIQGVENDREVTDMLILLLDDPGQSVRDNAKSCLERHRDKTSDGGLKQKITEAINPAKASGKSFAKLKDPNPEVRKKICEDLYATPKEIGSDEKLASLLMEIILNDQNEEVAAAARKALENAKYKADDGPIKETITAFFSNLKFFKYISDLESPDASARKTAAQNLGRDEATAKNEKALNGLIKLLSSDPEGSIKMEARIALDYQFSYYKDKMNPQIAEKIAHALGKTKPASSVATQNAQPAAQVDEYTASVDSLKDPKKARDAVKKLKTKYEKEAAADDSAMAFVIDIWLKKDIYDSSTRMDARMFLDWQKSYNKDKMKPELVQKIDEAFKAVKY